MSYYSCASSANLQHPLCSVKHILPTTKCDAKRKGIFKKKCKHFMHIIKAWRNQSASLVQLFISERCQEVKGNGKATFEPLKSLTHLRSWLKLVEVEHGVGWLEFGFCKWSSFHHHHHLPLQAYFIHHPSPNCKCLSVIWGPCRNSEPPSYNCNFACLLCGDSGSECKCVLELLKFHRRRRTTAAIASAHGYTHTW